MVTMGPVGLMKGTRKEKLFTIIVFFLEFFSWFIHLSSPGPNFVEVRASFGQVGDKVGQGFVCQVDDQFSQVKDQVGQGQGQELDNYKGEAQLQRVIFCFSTLR